MQNRKMLFLFKNVYGLNKMNVKFIYKINIIKLKTFSLTHTAEKYI